MIVHKVVSHRDPGLSVLALFRLVIMPVYMLSPRNYN